MSDLNDQAKQGRDIPDDITLEQMDSILKEEGIGKRIIDKAGWDVKPEDCRFMVEHFVEDEDTGEDIIQIVVEKVGEDAPWESQGAIRVYKEEEVGQYGLVVGKEISPLQYNTICEIAEKVGPKKAVE